MKIQNNIEPRAILIWDLDVNNKMRLRLSTTDKQCDYIIKVDYDWICWKYHIVPDIQFGSSDCKIDQICSDFDWQGRAKCFMFRILDKSLIKILLDWY